EVREDLDVALDRHVVLRGLGVEAVERLLDEMAGEPAERLRRRVRGRQEDVAPVGRRPALVVAERRIVMDTGHADRLPLPPLASMPEGTQGGKGWQAGVGAPAAGAGGRSATSRGRRTCGQGRKHGPGARW